MNVNYRMRSRESRASGRSTRLHCKFSVFAQAQRTKQEEFCQRLPLPNTFTAFVVSPKFAGNKLIKLLAPNVVSLGCYAA